MTERVAAINPDKAAMIMDAWAARALSTDAVDVGRIMRAISSYYEAFKLPPPRIAMAPGAPAALYRAVARDELKAPLPNVTRLRMLKMLRRTYAALAPQLELNLGHANSAGLWRAFAGSLLEGEARRRHERHAMTLESLNGYVVGQLAREHRLISVHWVLMASHFMDNAWAPAFLALTEMAMIEGGEANAEFVAYIEIAKSAGLVVATKETCYVCPRPKRISFDNEGELHAADGAAIIWRDGSQDYYWHGEEVPVHVMTDVGNWTVGTIAGESDLALRDIMIERYGIERYLWQARARVLHADETGKLWVKRHRGHRRFWSVVEVLNGTPEPDGSVRRYFLRVPPGMQTAKEAVAWTYGMTEAEYEVAVRT